MNTPVISICIPTYNRPACLKQCLDSIVKQFADSAVRDQVEILISDNASPDNTKQVVKSFMERNDNITYVRNEENLGVDQNMINVVAMASGEFVWFLGDDDALYPGSLAYMLKELEHPKFDYCIVNCLGYDNALAQPSVSHPNFDLQENKYFDTLADCVRQTPKDDLVGQFCGLSMQLFKRSVWMDWDRKEEYLGTHTLHLHIIMGALKSHPFAIIAKPLIKVRAANIRWDVFPGLETFAKRAKSTNKVLIWILDTYEMPYSKFALLLKEKKHLAQTWTVAMIKKHIFKSQKLRDTVKRLLGKL